MDKKNRAQMNLILAMTIWGTVGIFVRNINLPSPETAFFRALLAVIFLIFYMAIKKQKVALRDIKAKLP